MNDEVFGTLLEILRWILRNGKKTEKILVRKTLSGMLNSTLHSRAVHFLKDGSASDAGQGTVSSRQ
ncbi:hypothetical protein [Sporomusa carbonis]|uniref:hypothetical protein n=1 Tax=Sporomusa carbonis TaxID=3076075 RepID=UPI003C7B2AF3